MEWSVKHTRKYTGKVERKGMRKLLEKTVSRIPSEKSHNLIREELRSSGGNQSGSKPRTRDWFTAESPAILLHELIHHKIKLWHHSHLPIIVKYDKENPTYSLPYSYLLPENETLLPDVLLMFDIGLTRVVEYMQLYYIDDAFRVDRSEKEVPLTKLLASSVDRKKELKRMIDREVSLSANELDDALDKEEAGLKLKTVVDLLNETRSDVEDPHIVKIGQMSKEKRIQNLIEFRRMHFQKRHFGTERAGRVRQKRIQREICK